MDQETANRLIHEYGVVLFIEMPPVKVTEGDVEEDQGKVSLIGFRIGIDGNAFTVGPNFKGFKLIPYGTHFIHYS